MDEALKQTKSARVIKRLFIGLARRAKNEKTLKGYVICHLYSNVFLLNRIHAYKKPKAKAQEPDKCHTYGLPLNRVGMNIIKFLSCYIPYLYFRYTS